MGALPKIEGKSWDRIKEWFDHCSDLSQSERDSFLMAREVHFPEEVEEVRQMLGMEVTHPESVPPGEAPEVNPGEYEWLGALGEGGMAEVVLARWRSPSGERLVAVKRLHKRHMADKQFLDLFRYEAELNRRLRHPNLVRMYDFRSWEGRYFMAVEYVKGKTLGEVIAASESGPLLPFEAAAYLFVEVAKGLAYSHAMKDPVTGEDAQLVHRDVTPGNILIGYDGSVKLTDFGIAKARDRLRITQSGLVRGTLPYLSPEQRTGGEATQRSDLFSLAAVFVESLTGVPFDSNFLLQPGGGKDPLGLLDPDIPTEMVPLLRRALAKDSNERFESVAEMLWAIKPFLPPEGLEKGKELLQGILRRTFLGKSPISEPAPAKPGGLQELDEVEDSNHLRVVPRPSVSKPPPVVYPKFTETQPGDPAVPVPSAPKRVTLTSTSDDEAWEQPRRSFRIRPKRWLAGLMVVGLGYWAHGYSNYLKALEGAPRVHDLSKKMGVRIFGLPGDGRYCQLEVDTIPPFAPTRLNREWFGGTTPTRLNLPCGKTVLISFKNPNGSYSHHPYTATEARGRKIFRLPSNVVTRLINARHGLWDFTTRHFGRR